MTLKKTIFSTGIFLIAVFLFCAESSAVLYEEISAMELRERIVTEDDASFIILDIRTPGEYDLGHIQGAVNIPLQQLGIRYYLLDRTKDIIIYCDYGLQSKVAAQILINLGFKDVYNLTGGLQQWNYALVTDYGGVNI